MYLLIVRIFLMVLVLLLAIPIVTRKNVAVRADGLLGGLLTYLGLAALNSAVWLLFALFDPSMINLVSFGILGLLLNGLAFLMSSKLMPQTFEVTSLPYAALASLIATAASYGIHLYIS